MKPRAACLVLTFVLLSLASAFAAAEPIIKPMKYHGPIPQSSFTLRAGFLGGPENTEMIDALDALIRAGGEAFSNDFSNALSIDACYMHKLHPQFAVRLNANASFLRTDSNGRFVPPVTNLPDSVDAPLLDYTRDFDVDLFVLEASALYYFADAAVQEFQTYIGGGLSLGVPHAKFNETRIDEDTGGLYEEIDKDRWSVEPGVHAILGASYYVTNNWAVNVEGRGQIMQSRFPIDVLNRETGEFEEVDVIVKYDGFLLNVGVTRAF